MIAERTLHLRDREALVQEVAAFLLHENRTGELGSLMRDVMKYRFEHGIVEATVVSAHEVDTANLSEVKSLLKAEYPDAKTYHINTRVEPGIVGGIRIELAHQQLDLTLRRKLSTFKRLTMQGKD